MTDFRALCEELLRSLENYPVQPLRDRDLCLRARTALTEQPVGTTPIPAIERLPCLEDCDAEGRCWFHSAGRAWCDWYLLKASSATDTETHWLPANALPTPRDRQ